MKFIIILFCSALIYIPESVGQDRLDSWSAGIGGGHFDSDVGLMLSIATPYFFHDRVATRISYALRWSEAYHNETGSSAAYSSVQPGIVYLIAQKDNVDIYAEGGLNFIFPNKLISEDRFVIGYFGMIGLDFSIYSSAKMGIIYFFEIGLASNVVKAERLEGKPRYSNGPIANTGFRFRL